MSLVELKVKNLTLAQEARLIRRYERAKAKAAKWHRDQQRALAISIFDRYLADPGKMENAVERGTQDRYLARLERKNHLVKVGLAQQRNRVKTGLPLSADHFAQHEHLEEADRQSLYMHRVMVVRPEARAAHLAMGFLRNVPYRAMESFTYEAPDWKNVERNVLRFASEDSRIVAQRFAQWLEEAKAHIALFEGKTKEQRAEVLARLNKTPAMGARKPAEKTPTFVERFGAWWNGKSSAA